MCSQWQQSYIGVSYTIIYIYKIETVENFNFKVNDRIIVVYAIRTHSFNIFLKIIFPMIIYLLIYYDLWLTFLIFGRDSDTHHRYIRLISNLVRIFVFYNNLRPTIIIRVLSIINSRRKNKYII